jgi:hypothetical protein
MSHDLKATESGTVVSRREFTLEAALAILAGCVITIADAGCGSSNSTPTTPTAPPADINGVVAANHAQPHIVTITGAMITAGNQVTLNIQGQSTHNHTINASQNNLLSLKNKQAVTITSSNDNAHMHDVTFTPV